MRMCLVFLLAVMLPGVAAPTPRIPASAEEVLEVLPARRLPLPTVSASGPEDQARAIVDILALLQLAQREGDPRYLGHAEARLDRLSPTTETRVLRARLQQANHLFPQALVNLHQVLQSDPAHTEALLLQASIYQVRGEYELAQQSCQRVQQLETLLLALACRAQVDGLSGKAEQALAQLQKLSALDKGLSPDQRTWIHLALGDLALRMGRQQVAGAAYRKVMQNSPDALAAYADWLLANNRSADVVPLLRDHTRHDGLLLRLTLAEHRLGLPGAQAHIQELQSRFSALLARGETVHLREEALFTLHLLGNTSRALLLARKNWQQQREPADLLIYKMAATSRKSTADLALIRKWLQSSRLQDVRLVMASTAR
ncbi:MAG: hypothetical protein Q7T32_04850 [Moraxellaceae bacterium]|nr:hypothetical protein [Moraxellaceae bacterium]